VWVSRGAGPAAEEEEVNTPAPRSSRRWERASAAGGGAGLNRGLSHFSERIHGVLSA